MYQQINLYQTVLIKKSEPLQAKQALWILGALLICLLLIGAFIAKTKDDLQTESAELDQQQQVVTDNILELEALFPVPMPSGLLLRKIDSLEKKLEGQRDVMEFFSGQNLGNNQSILETLDGLARHRSKGVWLRRISLLNGGRDVQLSGSAILAQQIPEYLQLLGEKKIFSGQVFSRLALNRLEENADQVDFNLDSKEKVMR